MPLSDLSRNIPPFEQFVIMMILLRGKDVNVYKSNAIFKTWAWIWSATQITLQFFVVTKAKRKKFLINCVRSFLIWINTTPTPPPHNETKTQINYYTKKMETKKKERKRTVISVKLSMYSPIIHRNTMWMKDRLLRQKQKIWVNQFHYCSPYIIIIISIIFLL